MIKSRLSCWGWGPSEMERVCVLQCDEFCHWPIAVQYFFSRAATMFTPLSHTRKLWRVYHSGVQFRALETSNWAMPWPDNDKQHHAILLSKKKIPMQWNGKELWLQIWNGFANDSDKFVAKLNWAKEANQTCCNAFLFKSGSAMHRHTKIKQNDIQFCSFDHSDSGERQRKIK